MFYRLLDRYLAWLMPRSRRWRLAFGAGVMALIAAPAVFELAYAFTTGGVHVLVMEHAEGRRGLNPLRAALHLVQGDLFDHVDRGWDPGTYWLAVILYGAWVVWCAAIVMWLHASERTVSRSVDRYASVAPPPPEHRATLPPDHPAAGADAPPRLTPPPPAVIHPAFTPRVRPGRDL